MQQDPLVLNDFRTYALNMGGTLVDLLRKEISMLSKVSPTTTGSVTSAGTLLDPLPASSGLPLPGGVPQPPPIAIPLPSGSLLPASPFPGMNIPAAGVSASGGSTVYSIGTNYAPLTVINIYGDVPENATLIAHRSPQVPFPSSAKLNKYPQSPTDLNNNLQNISSELEIADTSTPINNNSNQTNGTSGESNFIAEETQNGTNSSQLQSTASPEQPGNLEHATSTNTENSQENKETDPTNALQNTA